MKPKRYLYGGRTGPLHPCATRFGIFPKDRPPNDVSALSVARRGLNPRKMMIRVLEPVDQAQRRCGYQ